MTKKGNSEPYRPVVLNLIQDLSQIDKAFLIIAKVLLNTQIPGQARNDEMSGLIC